MMLLFLLTVLPLFGQVNEETALDAARASMRSAKYCFLITLDETGQPQARLMEPFEPDAGMNVWFGTNPQTRKVGQVRKDGRATLAYYDRTGPDYVTLIGAARVVDDLESRRKHWRKDFTMHFPGGPQGRHYTLIEFIPTRIELISTKKGIGNKPGSLLPRILDRTADTWKLRPE